MEKRRKASLASACLLIALCALAAPSSAQATTIVSSLTHYPSLGIVEGYTATNLSYPAAYYYNAVADAYLYDQNWLLRDQRYSEGGSFASATTVTSATPDMSYYLYGDHYAGAYFYYCDSYCEQPQYYDYCGFSQMAGGSYGGYYYFECYYFCYFFYYYVYLGGTFDAVTVPEPCPDIEALELRAISGNHNPGLINNTTQTAMLGATVILQAVAISDEGEELAGSYVWTTSPGGQFVDPQGTPNYRKYIYWETEGVKQVQVTFTPPGRSCQVSASVNIDVVLPQQITFTASQSSARVRPDCTLLGPQAFSLGCGLTDPGILFTATVQGPAAFISVVPDSKIKFVQWTSLYATAHTNEGFICATRRNSEYNVESGWFRDGADPYGGNAITIFNENGSASLGAIDSPGYEVTWFDYFRNDDYFEMYLVYVAGDPAQPRVSRPLSVIRWNWGGEVFFSSPGVWSSYTSYPPAQQRFGSPTNTMRIYYPGSPQSVDFGPCPGTGPDPNPTPDPCYGSGWNCY